MRHNAIVLIPFTAVIVGVVAAALIWFTAPEAGATSTPLSQRQIEQRAVAEAQKIGLQGQPTSIASKQMTRDEFSARVNLHLANPPDSATTLVWLVALRGQVVLSSYAPVAPNRDGTVPRLEFDNLWLLMSTEGQQIGYGALPAGRSLDLNAPVSGLDPYPTPQGGPNPGQAPTQMPRELPQQLLPTQGRP